MARLQGARRVHVETRATAAADFLWRRVDAVWAHIIAHYLGKIRHRQDATREPQRQREPAATCRLLRARPGGPPAALDSGACKPKALINWIRDADQCCFGSAAPSSTRSLGSSCSSSALDFLWAPCGSLLARSVERHRLGPASGE